LCSTQATKNEAELAGMREAHLRDSEAICDFLAWIEKEVHRLPNAHPGPGSL
jgi:Xaa-Pro aminopeptidase